MSEIQSTGDLPANEGGSDSDIEDGDGGVTSSTAEPLDEPLAVAEFPELLWASWARNSPKD